MELKEYKGILRTVQAGVGSLSEGPDYFLELTEPNDFGQTELFIRKEGHLWESDPNLHPFIGKNVIIMGEPIITKHVKIEGTEKSELIDYKEIKEI